MPLIDVPTVHAVTDAAILPDPEFNLHAAAAFRTLGPGRATCSGLPSFQVRSVPESARLWASLVFGKPPSPCFQSLRSPTAPTAKLVKYQRVGRSGASRPTGAWPLASGMQREATNSAVTATHWTR